MTVTLGTVVVTGFSTAARRWRCSQTLAADIVASFVECGFVVAVGADEYVVTDVGREVSEFLTEVASEFVEVEV